MIKCLKRYLLSRSLKNQLKRLIQRKRESLSGLYTISNDLTYMSSQLKTLEMIFDYLNEFSLEQVFIFLHTERKLMQKELIYKEGNTIKIAKIETIEAIYDWIKDRGKKDLWFYLFLNEI